MVNVLQAMILTYDADMVLTPTYWVHKLYLPMQDATFIPVSYDPGTYHHGDITLPGVDVVAMRDTEGQLWLALVNLDPHGAKEIAVDVSGLGIRSASGEVLTAPNVNTINTQQAPNNVTPRPIAGTVSGGRVTIELPSKSVAMIALEE
jgi:alpha-N-arabinofuranosidase